MKKHLAGIILCGFFGFCCLLAFLMNTSNGFSSSAVLGPFVLTFVFFGFAGYNLVCFIKFRSSEFVEKKDSRGNKVRFVPTAKTKGIWIDDTNKLWQIRFTAFPKTFHYSDLKDYKVVKETQRSSSRTSHSQNTVLGRFGGSNYVSGQVLSYLSLEIRLVDMQRFRWVLNVYNKHESLAEVEDAEELLKYIKDNQ